MTIQTSTLTVDTTTKTTGMDPMDLKRKESVLRDLLSVLASCFRSMFRRRRTHAETCMRRFGEDCDC